jgi:ABC-type phosphate/phosphonate transport system substrate-binding protein
MIANARMYSVTPEVAGLWRALLSAVIDRAGLSITVLEHPEPAPIDELWARPDQAAVFMCGLPYSRSKPRPVLIAAPVPSPADFDSQPRYWSELVVRADSNYHSIEDTFGRRIAFTVADSQSGCLAALSYLMAMGGSDPLYREVIAPQITPLGVMDAVIRGIADVAPVDSYAFCLLQRYRPDLTAKLRVVARTAHTPIPPIVASNPGLDSLQAALLEAHHIASIQPLMATLMLQSFVHPDPASYDVLQLRSDVARQYWRQHPLATVVHPAFAQ